MRTMVYQRLGFRWCVLPLLASAILLVMVSDTTVQPSRRSITAGSHLQGVPGCKQHADIAADWPMQVPSWYNHSDHSCVKHFQPARQGTPEQGGNHSSQYEEDVYAYKHFFHGKVAGSYLELGGLDGQRFSNTHWYHTHLAWHGLLIEGDPRSYANLAANRPNDITVHAAVCHERRKVHYAECEESAVSGIEEFMSDNFKKTWALQLEKAVKTEITCLPLGDILAYYNITHIDFFSLDVEGGELMVLRSINFDCVTFDVLVVELDDSNPQKDADVRDLLSQVGYDKHSRTNNNEWFVRRGFKASAGP